MTAADNVRRNLQRIGWLPRAEAIVAEYPTWPDQAFGRSYRPMAQRARLHVWRELHAAGLSYSEVAAVFDRTHWTVMRALKRGAE